MVLSLSSWLEVALNLARMMANGKGKHRVIGSKSLKAMDFAQTL
jgi:hypothetical protein